MDDNKDDVKFFKTQKDFRKWLEKNHAKKQELWVGFYKKATGKPSISYPQSVDEALCFGWIDGIRKSIDEESYKNRFTPRRRSSNWSAINIKRIKELIGQGLVSPAGIAAFEKLDIKRTNLYSFEQQNISLDESYEKQLKANKKACEYFLSMPPSYRKPCMHWVMSAKQEATRQKRLDILIKCSEGGEKIPLLRWEKK